MDAMSEMPRYKCFKEVWALKIQEIRRQLDGDGLLVPSEEGFALLWVPIEYLQKHNPQPGGYYVVYQDGYKSYSPAEAFEAGYERIN